LKKKKRGMCQNEGQLNEHIGKNNTAVSIKVPSYREKGEKKENEGKTVVTDQGDCCGGR